MQAQDQRFKVGDKAVYPAQGVAEVISIQEKEIAGNAMEFYVLRLLDTDQTIMVPIARAGAVGLRRPISEKDVRKIFVILKQDGQPHDPQVWSRRYRGFIEKLKTGTVFDVAEAMRDLYRLQLEKDLSYVERRMLDTARKLIVKEIAVARSRSPEQVQMDIDAIFQTN